jgi:uncharacterized protein YfbU (UPF0304 family)
MELTRKERWMLWNQFRILEMLDHDEGRYYAQAKTALERGYEQEFDRLIEFIWSDDQKMTERESMEVVDILHMFSSLQRSYENLVDRTDIEPASIQFLGFDGNNEGKQMLFAQYFCDLEGGRFTELGDPSGFNSHIPTLERYRGMVGKWKRSSDVNHLSREDILRITTD